MHRRIVNCPRPENTDIRLRCSCRCRAMVAAAGLVSRGDTRIKGYDTRCERLDGHEYIVASAIHVQFKHLMHRKPYLLRFVDIHSWTSI